MGTNHFWGGRECVYWRDCFIWHCIINYICTAAVRKEIQDETDRETGRSKQISSVPIHLSIYSPNGKTRLFFGWICLKLDLSFMFMHETFLLDVVFHDFLDLFYFFFFVRCFSYVLPMYLGCTFDLNNEFHVLIKKKFDVVLLWI